MEYYTHTFYIKKVPIVSYIYFHSDLLLLLDEIDENNLQLNKNHPSSRTLTYNNYLLFLTYK